MTTVDAGSTEALGHIDDLVQHLFRSVALGLTRATDAFLHDDAVVARSVIANDTEFDTVQDEIELLVENQLRLRGGDSESWPTLLAVLRIVPELERSGDLVEHIALRTAVGLTGQLSATARQLIAAMGEVGVELWGEAARAYADRDPAAADRLRLRDDDLDDLHVRLTEELAAGSMGPAAAIELGLMARFYERLGDHAVNVTRRVPKPAASASAS